jgi:hypothetical protein
MFIEQYKVTPQHPDGPLRNVDLMLLVNKIESANTRDVLKYLLIADRLHPQGTSFYSNILCSGSEDKDDENLSNLKNH